MQLNPPPGAPTPLRSRLQAAACLLFAAGLPAMARGEPGATTQFDATALLYGEASRTRVVEPTARITRLSPSGQSISVQLGLDVITGATPSGAMPPGRQQTITSASGHTTTIPGDQLPLTDFSDNRIALDANWQRPFGLVTPALGGHYSREKDYQSLGAEGKLSFELMHKLLTVTAGAGIHHDSVFPSSNSSTGESGDDLWSGSNSPAPAAVPGAPGSIAASGSNSHPKQVTSTLLGLSRVLTRRWMLGVSAAHGFEQGYLDEPYKVVSLIDGATGLTTGEVADSRPTRRNRTSVLGSSVYHFTSDVLYVTYRYYWDDWQVRSNTVDLKYRHELHDGAYFEPHLRAYAQSAGEFFTFGLVDGTPLPEFATSDMRLGPLRTVTVGGTYGFRIPDQPGEWTVRAEFMSQFGNGHPSDAVGVQKNFDLFPTVGIGSLLVGYSVQF
jgi:hypothetical protein